MNLSHFSTTIIADECNGSSKDGTLQHDEYSYLNLCKEILDNGEKRTDRTNVGTLSLFGKSMEFNLLESFPLLTTKQMWFKGIVEELLFFISGCTDTKVLEAKGVNIWKGNTSAEYLQKHNLNWQEGDMGPMYPFQWRHAGSLYEGCNREYEGIDQLKQLIERIKIDPASRRHIISSWDVVNIDKMVLPPCHCMVQFNVGFENNVPTYLDCCLTQRSGDMFLGVPFNIASYSLLTYIVGHLTGLKARRFVHNIGDAHIYLNHVDQIKEQLTRTPYPFPKLTINSDCNDIDNIKLEDIQLKEYKSWPKLVGTMAV